MGHAWHTIAPADKLKLPAGHGWQKDAPAMELKVPGAHGVGPDDGVAQYWPGAAAQVGELTAVSQDNEPTALVVRPAGQAVQAVAPVLAE